MSDIMYCSTPLTLTPTEGQGAAGRDAAVMGPRMGHQDSGTMMGMSSIVQEHYRFRSVFSFAFALLLLSLAPPACGRPPPPGCRADPPVGQNPITLSPATRWGAVDGVGFPLRGMRPT